MPLPIQSKHVTKKLMTDLKMKKQKIEYKISVSPSRNMCDYGESGEFVKKFKISALMSKVEIGSAQGYIFNMFPIMQNEMLDLFDDTDTTARLFSALYHGTPLDASIDSVINGFKPECLNALNEHFDSDFYSIEDDDDSWIGHYEIVIGFLYSVDVDSKYRNLGIGSKMMNMLKRFRNTVDFMFLQSYPAGILEEIRELKLGHEGEDRYFKTEECKNRFEDGQLKIDKFYSGLGYKPFKSNDCVWMVMDKYGLRALEKESRKSLELISPEPF